MLELGVCYYPEQWPEKMWQRDAQRMVDLGLTWVRIGEFAWSLIEEEEGVFNWDWLDRAVDILGKAGLKVVMCTPSAAPPKWLVDKHPEILPVDAQGRVRKFGARRHYCFSSNIYREHAVRIAAAYAKRYGANPIVKAWQIDNEYGDHDTIHSYSENAKKAFQSWLANRYQNIDALNQAWGTVFWSMKYNRFDQIELPNSLVEEPSPTHLLDYQRFASDEVIKFNRAQVDIVRKYAPGRPVTHNFMGHNSDFDHYKVGQDLDFASWDSYPMGALIHGKMDEAEKAQMLRTGIIDQPAFNNDLYRQAGQGRAWIMEQQPGPVNWAAHNQSPHDGMVRLWTWLAFAHGIDVVVYFRWRQSKFAQEQFHAGLLLPNDEPDQAFFEVAQVAKEVARLPNNIADRTTAKVALMLDYASRWASLSLPQGADYSSARNMMNWYQALSARGVDVDIVGPHNDLTAYALVILPDMILEDTDVAQKLAASKAKVYLGARSGSKTQNMHIPDNLPPGAFAQLIDVKVKRVESLPAYNLDRVEIDGEDFSLGNWRECVESDEPVLARFKSNHRDQSPALLGNEKCWYGAANFSGGALDRVVEKLLAWADVPSSVLNANVRITQRGPLSFAFNFGEDAVDIKVPADAKILLGEAKVGPRDLVIWRE
ncbi:beta-galactosidase [Maritalea mediterranea]|uniref:Beta-galactosidase n=1 Tax=Maritalea mediterranea TaxID=2909667 RepID=A0ABS9E314_9HYPH|nr:beta-galactosidase [Maritalea mediterranea]MCF4097268.1 beta-galactosidase [Maritalea mediterranea]